MAAEVGKTYVKIIPDFTEYDAAMGARVGRGPSGLGTPHGNVGGVGPARGYTGGRVTMTGTQFQAQVASGAWEMRGGRLVSGGGGGLPTAQSRASRALGRLPAGSPWDRYGIPIYGEVGGRRPPYGIGARGRDVEPDDGGGYNLRFGGRREPERTFGTVNPALFRDLSSADAAKGGKFLKKLGDIGRLMPGGRRIVGLLRLLGPWAVGGLAAFAAGKHAVKVSRDQETRAEQWATSRAKIEGRPAFVPATGAAAARALADRAENRAAYSAAGPGTRRHLGQIQTEERREARFGDPEFTEYRRDLGGGGTQLRKLGRQIAYEAELVLQGLNRTRRFLDDVANFRWDRMFETGYESRRRRNIEAKGRREAFDVSPAGVALHGKAKGIEAEMFQLQNPPKYGASSASSLGFHGGGTMDLGGGKRPGVAAKMDRLTMLLEQVIVKITKGQTAGPTPGAIPSGVAVPPGYQHIAPGDERSSFTAFRYTSWGDVGKFWGDLFGLS